MAEYKSVWVNRLHQKWMDGIRRPVRAGETGGRTAGRNGLDTADAGGGEK